MTSSRTPEVVVGVDGSDQSLRAVRWAAREAAGVGARLRIVHAWMDSAPHVPLGPATGFVSEGSHQHSADYLLTARRQAAAWCADDTVETLSLHGAADVALTLVAEDADLLVVGDHGQSGLTGLLLGSVAAALTRIAPCPLVVVRGRHDAAGPVVVGVSGDPNRDHEVLAVAFERAEHTGVGVVAIHAASLPVAYMPVPPWAGEVSAIEAAARDRLAAVLTDQISRHPSVPVEQQVVLGAAATALIGWSGRAGLVMIGSHGAPALIRYLGGSISDTVLHAAHCPVEIIRTGAETPRRRDSAADHAVTTPEASTPTPIGSLR
jgi:nucleotide-binding universal stress UspA family protein